MRNRFSIILASLLVAMTAQADFIIPDFPGSAQNDFAWWTSFTDPFTNWQLPDTGQTVTAIPGGEGNTPDPLEGNNHDAILIQNGDSEARIAGSGGIYGNSGINTEFVIYDAPAFETDSVLLQIQSIGSQANVGSAELFYRETANGPLLSAGGVDGSGFLLVDTGESFDDTFTAWEWDLTAETIYDFFIRFVSEGSSMSLQQIQLDSFDDATNNLGYPLIIETNSAFAPVGTVNHHKVGESVAQLSYQAGDSIQLTPVADPAYGHSFVGWRNALSGTSNPAILTMAEDTVVEAIFAPTTYTFWTYNQINPFDTSSAYSARTPSTADPDNNGLSNLIEYALGGLPESQEDEAAVRPQVSLSNGHLQLTFKKQLAATDLTYRVKVSDDLVNWHYNGDGTGQTYTELLTQTTFNSDGTETVTYQDLTPIPANGSRFMTLEVILN